MVLSPVEQRIREKIEKAGKPLKDWDIRINYGIKTGCNEAFIISTKRREEILADCGDEAERSRTAALIRPILRGRDIKRYSCEWAGLWLINTHNGIKGRLPRIWIEDYPAVKAHLDQYWPLISKRADRGDTPYNLRNCAYLEDFERPRIVYREIGAEMDACLVDKGWMINNKLYMISGKYLMHLLNFFNSKLFNRIILPSANLTGGKGVDFMENVVVPLPGRCNLSDAAYSTASSLLYQFYNLTQEEINYIDSL
ncbi:MAG: hypothetical protein LUE08_00125 [Akkermansiaceae bacterium]|nr:hypothetical protein [Akkermansiaceae bacterium]